MAMAENIQAALNLNVEHQGHLKRAIEDHSHAIVKVAATGPSENKSHKKVS